jgi:ornithine cyclodeaminase
MPTPQKREILTIQSAGSGGFSLDASTTAILEAPTWAMIALGFAGLGFVAFRRNRRQLKLKVPNKRYPPDERPEARLVPTSAQKAARVAAVTDDGDDNICGKPTLRGPPMLAPPSAKALVPFVSVQNMMRLAAGAPCRGRGHARRAYGGDRSRFCPLGAVRKDAAHRRLFAGLELIPISDGELYSFKYVNGHPKNPAGGLQTVTAIGLLAEVNTGYPLLLAEMTLLTALRTAATSALAARYLNPEHARTMALIGNGAQAEFQALVMRAVCGIKTVRLYDVDSRATEKVRRNLHGTGLALIACPSAEAAVEGAEIITTSTADRRSATILTDAMVGPGVHFNAIGGDCPGKTELSPLILQRSDVFVEYAPQTRIEGEIQQMEPDFPVTELWEVVVGAKPGRRYDKQNTVFDGVGFAIEDFSALRYVRQRLPGADFHEELDLVADPDDPRDLYGMLMRAA